MKNISHIKISPRVVQRQARVFKALASPFRLAIVLLLNKEEMSVNEIVACLQDLVSPQTLERTNVCKNLGLLKKMGILSCRKEQQKRIYYLKASCLIRAIDCTLELKA